MTIIGKPASKHKFGFLAAELFLYCGLMGLTTCAGVREASPEVVAPTVVPGGRTTQASIVPSSAAALGTPTVAPGRRSCDPSDVSSPIMASRTPIPVRPAIATVAIPDPDRTAWPHMIERFDETAVIPDAELAGRIVGFHLDPARVRFRVHYTPGQPHFISEWARSLSRDGERPLLVFPAGFFTAEHYALGLLVADGHPYSPANSLGGVFVVKNGLPEIRWLERQPITPGESFEQAVQAFPVYVSRGVIPPLREHEERAPRTLIAETKDGGFVFLISPTNLFRTIELAQWLVESDLEIHNALNLDGGSSAGYWAGAGDYVDSQKPIPAVVAVYAK